MREIEIPDGCEAKIVGNKVVFVPKESEDERIRMDILEALRYGLACEESTLMPGAKTTLKEAIAYLEKHKEQKTIEDVVKDITKNKEAATKFLKSAGIMDGNGELAEMYRSESKPAEWSEEDAHNLSQFIEKLAKTYEFNLPNRGYDIFGFAKDTLKYLRINHGKVEWDEEHEAKKERLISIVKRALHGNEHPLLNDNGATELITWLKTLRPQPQQEWSEEDEAMLQHIVSDLREFRDCETNEELISDYEDEISWLKSLRPKLRKSWSMEDVVAMKDIQMIISVSGRSEKNKRALRAWVTEHCNAFPLPHWKPSKEQLDALDNIASAFSPKNKEYKTVMEYVNTLREDLKKL